LQNSGFSLRKFNKIYKIYKSLQSENSVFTRKNFGGKTRGKFVQILSLFCKILVNFTFLQKFRKKSVQNLSKNHRKNNNLQKVHTLFRPRNREKSTFFAFFSPAKKKCARKFPKFPKFVIFYKNFNKFYKIYKSLQPVNHDFYGNFCKNVRNEFPYENLLIPYENFCTFLQKSHSLRKFSHSLRKFMVILLKFMINLYKFYKIYKSLQPVNH